MKYNFFESQEERNGNKAFYATQFDKALIQYNTAKEKLIALTSQKNFKIDKNYQDNLAFVLGEIIITTAKIALSKSEKKLNNDELTQIWEPISALCEEMNSLYKKISRNTKIVTDKNRIHNVYQLIAQDCKEISETFIQSIKKSHSSSSKKITQALGWFSKAAEYLSKAGDTADLELHLSYLALLETGFEYTEDLRFLVKMQVHITDNSLHQSESASLEQKLQVLYYQFLATTNNKNENVSKFEKQYKALIQKSRKIDKDNLFVLKFEQLIENLSSKKEDSFHENESLPSSKIDESIILEKNNAKKTNKARKANQSVNEFNDAESTSSKNKKKIKKANKIKTENSVASQNDETSSVTTQDDNWMADALSELSETPSHDAELNNLLKRTRNIDFKDQPAQKKHSKMAKSETHPSHAPFTFFASPPPLLTSIVTLLQTHHHDVFKQMIIEMAKNYKDSEFLANLLSLIGDFYFKSCSLLPLENNWLMAASFYEAALKLNANHPVASIRLQEISNEDLDLIYTPPNEQISSQENIILVFTQAIENNMIQIDQVIGVSANGHQVDKTFDDLTHFIANTIRTKELAGSKSQPIAELIITKYELALLKYEQALTKGADLGNEINSLR